MKTLETLGVACMLLFLGCDPEPSGELDARDGELMFDLDEDELVAFHQTYRGTSELALTRDRLTAPFDCGLFDDYCAQVGREAAIEITGMQVELFRDGATVEQMNERTAAWISDAMDAYDPDDDAESTFRSSGAWADRVKDGHRLRVRNGITTPAAGDREAWTQSKFQSQDWLGVWWQTAADELCVNAGPNTQEHYVWGSWDTIEYFDPVKVCWLDDGNQKKITYHDVHISPGGLYYRITADGCGSAEHNGTTFGICANAHVQTF